MIGSYAKYGITQIAWSEDNKNGDTRKEISSKLELQWYNTEQFIIKSMKIMNNTEIQFYKAMGDCRHNILIQKSNTCLKSNLLYSLLEKNVVNLQDKIGNSLQKYWI